VSARRAVEDGAAAEPARGASIETTAAREPRQAEPWQDGAGRRVRAPRDGAVRGAATAADCDPRFSRAGRGSARSVSRGQDGAGRRARAPRDGAVRGAKTAANLDPRRASVGPAAGQPAG
jgi:hypothetical protein